MPTSCSESSFMRQLSEKEKGGGWKVTSKSKRWAAFDNNYNSERGDSMEGAGIRMMREKRKRVMVVVDESLHTKHAMLWALTHVANKGDILTLVHIITNIHQPNNNYNDNHLVTSLATLCKACKPEVEVEALVIQGGKLETVVSQVKKLEVSVLVLGQKNSSPFLLHCLGGMSSTEKFVEQCINTVECLTIGVRKQSKGVGGYLISTRWRKDFWLLA